MDDELKKRVLAGMDLCRLLAAQTRAAFDEYFRKRGHSKAEIISMLEYPIRSFKETMRPLVSTIDKVAIKFGVEDWRVWGILQDTLGVRVPNDRQGVYALAIKWEVHPDTLAAIYLDVLPGICFQVRVEQLPDGEVVLALRDESCPLGKVALSECVGLVNEYFHLELLKDKTALLESEDGNYIPRFTKALDYIFTIFPD